MMENVIITGATKGIGRSIAFAFAKQGLNLAICSRNNQQLLHLKDELLKINPAVKVITRQADCSVKTEVLAFAGFAEQELGFISVVVNNVGIYELSSILDDEDDTFDKLISTNLMPAYQMYRYFGKTMMASGRGHIFSICSIAAITPVIEAGIYTVTKAALRSLNDVMRLEMRQYGVKVTTVIPGSTLTASWAGTTISADNFVQPDDVASAIISAYQMSAGANVDEVLITPVKGQL
jgi:short-subunit dehydrogenase